MTGTEGELDQVDVDGEPPEFDLTPRTSAAGAGRGPVRKRRNLGAKIFLGLVVIAGAYIVTQQLGSATQFFYTADQAVAKRGTLGTARFKIEGTVVDEPVRQSAGKQQKADFTIAANGISVPVNYEGQDPPSMFEKCEPVVLVGNWDGTHFSSDQIIVKHDSTYKAEHPGRLEKSCSDAKS